MPGHYMVANEEVVARGVGQQEQAKICDHVSLRQRHTCGNVTQSHNIEVYPPPSSGQQTNSFVAHTESLFNSSPKPLLSQEQHRGQLQDGFLRGVVGLVQRKGQAGRQLPGRQCRGGHTVAHGHRASCQDASEEDHISQCLGAVPCKSCARTCKCPQAGGLPMWIWGCCAVRVHLLWPLMPTRPQNT